MVGGSGGPCDPGRSLTELAGIGPSLAKRLHGWLDAPPAFESPPVRREFLTLAQARKVLAKNPQWRARLNGDLQMHTEWSDGGGTISEMAAAAIERGYKFIAITDHTKGLKIAGGLDEERLEQQGREIAILNKQLRTQGIDFTILRSAEMNLSPTGEGDMRTSALRKLDLVLGCFVPHYAARKIRRAATSLACGTRTFRSSAIRNPRLEPARRLAGRLEQGLRRSSPAR